MHPILSKTFGGLSKQYYFRQIFFGVLIALVLIIIPLSQPKHIIQIPMFAIFIVNIFLYPYSRFVYESIVGFIMGRNTFFVNATGMLVTKFFTMCLCWGFAIFIAPIGLAYLYYHHSKSAY